MVRLVDDVDHPGTAPGTARAGPARRHLPRPPRWSPPPYPCAAQHPVAHDGLGGPLEARTSTADPLGRRQLPVSGGHRPGGRADQDRSAPIRPSRRVSCPPCHVMSASWPASRSTLHTAGGGCAAARWPTSSTGWPSASSASGCWPPVSPPSRTRAGVGHRVRRAGHPGAEVLLGAPHAALPGAARQRHELVSPSGGGWSPSARRAVHRCGHGGHVVDVRCTGLGCGWSVCITRLWTARSASGPDLPPR